MTVSNLAVHLLLQQVWLEEMTEGLFGEGVESGGEEGGGDGTIPLLKRPIRAGDRKTRKVKRKERERQDEVRHQELFLELINYFYSFFVSGDALLGEFFNLLTPIPWMITILCHHS